MIGDDRLTQLIKNNTVEVSRIRLRPEAETNAMITTSRTVSASALTGWAKMTSPCRRWLRASETSERNKDNGRCAFKTHYPQRNKTIRLTK